MIGKRFEYFQTTLIKKISISKSLDTNRIARFKNPAPCFDNLTVKIACGAVGETKSMKYLEQILLTLHKSFISLAYMFEITHTNIRSSDLESTSILAMIQ